MRYLYEPYTKENAHLVEVEKEALGKISMAILSYEATDDLQDHLI